MKHSKAALRQQVPAHKPEVYPRGNLHGMVGLRPGPCLLAMLLLVRQVFYAL